MAVIKHIASKNCAYGESERYLIFQHNEYTQKPILDEEGHNKSGNIHVHIVIYSLRKYDISQEPYMEFDSEATAGYKHHLSTAERSLCSKSKAHQFEADGSDCRLHTGTWL